MESAGSFFAELDCARALVAMAAEGARLGWHEANGGNASYRLRSDELELVRRFCVGSGIGPGPWQPLTAPAPGAADGAFLVTAAGSFMGKLGEAPAGRLGVIEVDGAGERFRALIGFCGGARPTSELAGHLLIHGALADREPLDRVLYHAHPDAVIALSKLVEPEPRAMTRALWNATTECILSVPEGVGAVPCLVPGSLDLARASAEQMVTMRAVVWASHGLLCSGTTCDDAFGRMQSLAKAANVQLLVRAAGGDASRALLPEGLLRAMDEELGLGANPAYLAADGE